VQQLPANKNEQGLRKSADVGRSLQVLLAKSTVTHSKTVIPNAKRDYGAIKSTYRKAC